MPSMYQLHVLDWKNCTRCELKNRRHRVVLGRGQLPCDIVFIGEAPGQSEDTIGTPFEGPAGRLMDEIIRRALPPDTTYALTNLVGCIPLGDDGAKSLPPPYEAIEACTPRLQAFVQMANPKLIVAVGALSKTWLQPGYRKSIKFHRPTPLIDIHHPAYILRQTVAMRGLAIQRCVVIVSNALLELDTLPKCGVYTGVPDPKAPNEDDIPF